MEFAQGQWIKATIGETVQTVMPDGSLCAVERSALPPLFQEGSVGVWYPAGKRFMGINLPTGVPVATFWPVDSVEGMPVLYEGRRLCFVADSVVPLSSCACADLPPQRFAGMSPEDVARFVEVNRG